MFCHITQSWRGRPLTNCLAIVELIGATTTKTGLKIECAQPSYRPLAELEGLANLIGDCRWLSSSFHRAAA